MGRERLAGGRESIGFVPDGDRSDGFVRSFSIILLSRPPLGNIFVIATDKGEWHILSASGPVGLF